MKRLLLLVGFVAAFQSYAVGAPVQFSFAPPTGWRLEAGVSSTKATYWFRRETQKEPRCSVGVGAEEATTLANAQDFNLSRLRSTLTGPSEPKIHRSTLRSNSGVRILKAEVLFDGYSQPQYRRGAVFPLRCIYYSFQTPKDGRIYSLECWPEVRYGTYFDSALDDLARSIAF